LIFHSISIQSKPRPIPPILKKLLTLNESVLTQNLFVDNWIEIEDLPSNFKLSLQKIIKTKNGIFLNIDGTGRVYKFFAKDNLYEFVRIDSTYFSGYNFGSVFFNLNDSIYSFGGEGFWNTNGDLRLFDLSITNEWHAQKLNKIIHGSFSSNTRDAQFVFFNTSKKQLIISGPPYEQSHILKNSKFDSLNHKKLFQLNISNGQWTEIGNKNFESNQQIAITPDGFFNDEFFIDFNRNKILRQKNKFLSLALLKSTINNKVSITFVKDSILYFGNCNGLYDSIYLSKIHFEDTGMRAFIPDDNSFSNKVDYSILTISIFSIFTLFGIYYLKHSRINKMSENEKMNKDTIFLNTNKNMIPDIEPKPQFRSGRLIELLTEQEINFLGYLYSHSLDERMTTIEEINRKLGTSNKRVEIQKKMRSDMINGINNKLSIFSKSSTPVIEKQRSEFDKRSFEYYIAPEKMELVNDIINVNKS
jgi:hypothetical protein